MKVLISRYAFTLFSLAVLVTLSVASVTAKPGPRAEPDYNSLDAVVAAELKEKHTPGAVVAIVSDDKVIYAKAFGLANVETNAPMQKEMLFRIGSTTKMFTAAALVKLSEAGKIKLNEPIGNRVKSLSPRLSQVTPHYLLSNSAGVSDFAPPFISQDDESLGRMVRGWKDDVLFAEQGEIYSYSSPGFWLSGFIVEELSGKSYADAMDELLFKPLGMNRTTLRPLMAMTYPLAGGHNVSAEGAPAIIRPFYNNVAQWPAGSIFSNINDLSRWVIAFMNAGRLEGKQVLSAELVSQMSRPHIAVPGEKDSFYAYGLTTFRYQGVQFVAHGGFSRGYGSMIQMAPERKFAVIVLTNKSGETLRRTLNRASELGLNLQPEEPEKPKSPPSPTPAELAEYVGSYKGTTNWDVYLKDGKLFVKNEGTDYLLTASGERKFSFGSANENELVFVPGKTGRIEFIFSELYSAKKVKAGR
ncbi:MAG: serine hydrolase domain-containing protein [Acidobacteriota bacterium]